jgi:hypothetical protein
MVVTPSVKGLFKALVTDQLISRVVEATVGVVVAGPVGRCEVNVARSLAGQDGGGLCQVNDSAGRAQLPPSRS